MEPAQPLDDVLILSVVHLSSIRPCDKRLLVLAQLLAQRVSNHFGTPDAKKKNTHTVMRVQQYNDVNESSAV